MKTRRIETAQDASPSVNGHLSLTSKQPRKSFELKDFTLIGRDPSCDVRLEDDSVSTRHARIEFRDGAFYIRDLRSKNGTIVNGAHILEAKLAHLDRLQLGESELVFTHNNLDCFKTPSLASKNAAWSNQLKLVPNMAQSNLPVLIIGPSGSGKEVLANEIHRLSSRQRGPLISVNCGALSENLIESELFGHIKGSFTGAQYDRKGAFETARKGTLFLDEIGELPLSLQPKLLRALENNEIKPVGGDQIIPIDVRIIAATNQNLRERVRRGEFREDLYFRLNVLQLEPPALHLRNEDFDDLLQYFSAPLRVRFTSEAYQTLKKHPWPGNIRELRNTVLRSAALFPDRAIGINELLQILEPSETTAQRISDLNRPIDALNTILPATKDAYRKFEKEMIIEQLTNNQGNQRQAARMLGLAKSTLHDKLKTYGINPKSFEPITKNQLLP